MFRVINFTLAVLLSLTFHVVAIAQEVKPLGEAEKANDARAKQVKELEILQNEIVRAQNIDKKIEQDRLFELLKATKNEESGRYVANAIWHNWIEGAPNQEVNALVSKAMERRRWYDYEGARLILNEVVEKAPDYAEGWNQRGYIFFLQEKFDKSMEDISRALTLEPRHFGALSGKARILFHQGRHKLARDTLKIAVDIHPWLYERFLIADAPRPSTEPVENTSTGKDEL